MYVFFGKANIMTLYRYIQRTGTDGVFVLRNTKPCLYIYAGANVKFFFVLQIYQSCYYESWKGNRFLLMLLPKYET